MPAKKTAAPRKTSAAKKAAPASKRQNALRSKAPAKAARKTSPKQQKELAPGAQYGCGVCGLVMSVDEACGCVDFCDIICCGEQMQPVGKG
ncbi:MAG: hypothetical protein AB1805_05320 [Nitrospirota bacterium]